MEENTIQLKKDNILRLKIKTVEGEYTGETLEFDLEDIELPLIYQDILEKDKKNKRDLQAQLLVIDKKQDHKGKKLMSANEEAKIKALNEFYKKEAEIYDMFLGENGVKKLLHGRKLGWTTLKEIDEIIEECILPKLNLTMDNITNKIKSKYSTKEDDVLE